MYKKSFGICALTLIVVFLTSCSQFHRATFGEPISTLPTVRDEGDAEQLVRHAYRLLAEEKEDEAGAELLEVARSFESRDGKFEFEVALTAAAAFLIGGDLKEFQNCMALARRIAERKRIRIVTARAKSLFFIDFVATTKGDPVSNDYWESLPVGVRKYFIGS